MSTTTTTQQITEKKKDKKKKKNKKKNKKDRKKDKKKPKKNRDRQREKDQYSNNDIDHYPIPYNPGLFTIKHYLMGTASFFFAFILDF